jgi:hypothetical protein
MKHRPLSLIAVLLIGTLLSGCFGYSQDSVRASDELGVLYTAKDAGSDAALPGECFIGWPFEKVSASIQEKFLGRTLAPGATITATATVPAGIACHPVHRVSAVAEELDRTQTVDRATFDARVREPPVAGKTYTIPDQTSSFTFTVVRFNATVVEYQPALPPVQSVAELGIDVVPEFRGDKIAYIMRANVTGINFEGPIGTAIPVRGNFTVIGNIGDELLVAEKDARPVLGSQSVQLTVTALFAHPSTREVPNGGFGHRDSSVVGRQPMADPLTSQPTTEAHDADGHVH